MKDRQSWPLKMIVWLSLCLLIGCQLKHEPKVDAERIKRDLDSIKVLDQLYRKELQDLYRAKTFDSVRYHALFEKQQKIDATNLAYVEKVIQEYGKYPGKSLLGPSTGNVAFYVLQHAHDSIQTKYHPLILQAALDYELSKGLAARYYDRYLLNIGKEQKFGTQIITKEVKDSLTGEISLIHQLPPIKDTNSIDSLRLWNGLIPLEDYLKSFGLSRWNTEKK